MFAFEHDARKKEQILGAGEVDPERLSDSKGGERERWNSALLK